MNFSLIPDCSFERLLDITPELLLAEGITLLLLDLDNTISPYGRSEPSKEALAWADNMKSKGVSLFIVSNNKSERPAKFARAMQIPYVKRAKKPSKKGILEALSLAEKKPEEAALAGDQIYTDVLGANRSGIKSFMVQPISLKNPIFAARYVLELPFRLMSRKKYRR